MNDDDPRVYVWFIMLAAVITMLGLYCLNRTQMRPTPAQESRLIAAVHAAQEAGE